MLLVLFFFFFSSRRRHTRCSRDWSSDVCSSDLLCFGSCTCLGGVSAGIPRGGGSDLRAAGGGDDLFAAGSGFFMLAVGNFVTLASFAFGLRALDLDTGLLAGRAILAALRLLMKFSRRVLRRHPHHPELAGAVDELAGFVPALVFDDHHVGGPARRRAALDPRHLAADRQLVAGHDRPRVLEALLRLEQVLARRERSEEHTSELQSRLHLVCRLLLEKKTLYLSDRKSRRLNSRHRQIAHTGLLVPDRKCFHCPKRYSFLIPPTLLYREGTS